ncbi:uncharacterized protein PV06_03063 [Exophiala oligosperma]|uniref:SnoaL-like domain-containing protein n=1 Tax=Exophiala oligosperma TaxID=215243 RepID=A0A0D2C4B1_9EURO|nr:uncharacterized protein PV06_03063 [Exophiala oligosperma]KIW44607.1 hypothetical protein PV06_03063 [Exophiala oligosperma]
MPNKSITYRPTDGSPVPALSICDHPLCYPTFLAKHRQRHGLNPACERAKPNQDERNGVRGDLEAIPSSLTVQKSEQDKLLYMYERQKVIDLCSSYAYTLDSTMMNLDIAHDWANLFTEDCVVTYPFGTHIGKEGLAKFGMMAESRFTRMLHIASNFIVEFESDTVAHARYTCFATHGLHESDISKHFMEAGYYYSSFRRVSAADGYGAWRFSHLTLDMVWTLGESLGLNEPQNGLAETRY